MKVPKIKFKKIFKDKTIPSNGWWYISYIGHEPTGEYFQFEEGSNLPNAYALGYINKSKILQIGDIFVKPEFRRHGLGKAVVANLKLHAYKLGAIKVRAENIQEDGKQFVHAHTFWNKLKIHEHKAVPIIVK